MFFVKIKSILRLLVIWSIPCTTVGQGREASVKNDSIMVNSLIRQSEENYKKNNKSTSPFDEYLREALEHCRQHQLKHQEAFIYNLAGKRERERANYAEAIQLSTKAVQIAEQLNEPPLLAEYNNQLGVVFRRIDENVLAVNAHMRAMRYAELARDTFNISVALNSMGNVKLSMQQNRTAIEYFQLSIALSTQMHNMLGLAINFNNMGEAYLNMKQPDSALHYFNKSLFYNEQINSFVGQAISFTSIGNTYTELNQFDQALQCLNKALALNLELGDPMYLSVNYSHLGKTFIQMGDHKKAIENLEKSLDISRKIGSKYQATEAAAMLAQLYESDKDYLNAYTYFKVSSQYKDSLLNEKNLQHVASMEAIYQSELKDSKIQELHSKATETTLMLHKQRYFFTFLISIAILTVVITLLVYYQSRLKSHIRNIRHQHKLLRLQMNPHFVFNALSALQVYILEHDTDKSSKFLTSFSKVMRKVLQSSNYEYIPLHEEIDILENYLIIQQLRFPQPFAFAIHVDPALENQNLMMPPLLAQPFVENAIDHGFLRMNEQSLLRINLMQNEESFVLEIDDNGLGIDQTRQNKESDEGHKSMAIKITQERLMVLQKETGKNTSLEITDKKHIGARGTMVRITLPKMYHNKKSIT